jgi:hypothetical protein
MFTRWLASPQRAAVSFGGDVSHLVLDTGRMSSIGGSVHNPPYQQSSRVKEATMPGTLKRIRDEMDVKPTPRDKGLTLTLRVTAYDNGMIEVDGVPINVAPAYDPGHGWLGAAETALLTLSEFRKPAERRKQKAEVAK